MHKKKKHEFSKIITVIGLAMWATVNIYAMVMMAVTLDLTPLAWAFGSVDAVVAVVLGFYYWKAKAENQIKLKQIYGDNAKEVFSEMSETTGSTGEWHQ